MASRHLVAAITLLFAIIATEAAPNITFVCPSGWELMGTHCYKFNNINVDKRDAECMCTRFGAELIRIRDEIEARDVSAKAKTIFDKDQFWIRNGDENMEECAYLWDVNEPLDVDEEDDDFREFIAVSSTTEGRWRITWQFDNYPFVCRTPAYPEGSFRCNNGKFINDKWRCDGNFDCEDHSDENDYFDAARCSGVIPDCVRHIKESSGSINSDTYVDNDNCQWIIEGEIGQTLKLTIQELQLADHADSVMIYSGGPTLETSFFNMTLREDIPTSASFSLFGIGQFFIIKLQSITTDARAELRISWEPDALLTRGEVETLDVTEQWQTTTTPYFDAFYVPNYYKKEWLLKAPAGQIITFDVTDFTFDMEENTTDFEFVTNSAVQMIRSSNRIVFVSNTNEMRVILRNDGADGRRASARFRLGCDFEVTDGFALMAVDGLPPSTTCTWKIAKPDSNDAPFGIATEFHFDDNDDSITFYSGTSEQTDATEIKKIDGTMNGSPQSFVNIPDGITIIYRSNIARSENSFTFALSQECPAFPDQVNMTVDETPGRVGGQEYKVYARCATGYDFKQGEYRGMDPLEFDCTVGGIYQFRNESFPRMPECEIIQCGIPPPLDNGYIFDISGSVAYGAEATYACFDGFDLQGTATVSCLVDGNWDTLPVCAAQTCTEPNVLSNGYFNVTGLDNSFGAIRTYHCNPGYDLFGAKQIVCNVTWSHPVPECRKLKCELPVIERASFSPSGLPEFEDTVTLSCDPGYVVNRTNTRTASLTCEANREMDFVDDLCINVDECDAAPFPCSDRQYCVDTPGSYQCICKDGFSEPSCSDIDECTAETDNCDGYCDNSVPGYTCRCLSGFTLYTANGTNGFFLPDGEDGARVGDVYHINHTCVRNVCDRPTFPAHGQILTQETRFLYEDVVNVACDFGYRIDGSDAITCSEDSSWTGLPSCVKMTCPQPPESRHEAARSPESGEIEPDSLLNITCTLNDGTGKQIHKILYCGPNSDDPDTFILQGDSPVCPEVDCGDPLDIPGANLPADLTSTTFGSSFTFTCNTDDGFELDGMSSNNDNTVTCLSYGRWGYNNLTCNGPSCSDPGTKAGTNQTVLTSYEIDQQVRYYCTQDGYTPVTSDTLTCSYNRVLEKAEWVGVPPVCQDTTAPTIDCPQIDALELYDTVNYALPGVSDNSGFTCLELTAGPPPGVALLTGSTTISYRVRDRFIGNTDSCSTTVTVRDRNPPSLTCKNTITEDLGSDNSKTLNITEEYIVLSSSTDGTLSLSPSGLVSIAVNDHIVVTATLVKANGLQKQCKTIIRATSTTCRDDFLIAPANGEAFSCSGTASAMSCTTNCTGETMFQDQRTSKTFECTNGVWDTAVPVLPCLQRAPIVFTYEATISFTTNGGRGTDYDAVGCMARHNDLLRQRVEDMSVCDFNTFSVANDIGSLDVSSNRFESTFTISVLTSGISETTLEACASTIRDNAGTLFGPTSPTVAGANCYGPWTVSSSTQEVTAQTFACTDRSELITQGTEFCLPCGPGYYYNSGTEKCDACDTGQYQDEIGQETCKPCANNVMQSFAPRTSSTQCYELCPEGFRGTTGYLTDPCSQCEENSFTESRPATSCTQCPNSGSTLGASGSTSELQCSAQCPPGEYSMSGYIPCTPCPKNFYQNSSGQTTCDECPTGTFFQSVGSVTQDDCNDNATILCDNFCSAEGTADVDTPCSINNHRPTCVCREAYHGEDCSQKCDVCQPNPCYNGGVCTANGFQYTCECASTPNCTFIEDNTISWGFGNRGELIETASTRDQCEEACLKRITCQGYYFIEGECYLFTTLEFGDPNENGDRYQKECENIYLFDGDNCENDLINNCETSSQCSKPEYCQDLVDGTTCVCPREGNYDELCNLPSNLCENQPCGDHGECRSYGSVRFICQCDPGYTGTHCETNVPDCDDSFACSENCNDGQSAYTCECHQGFVGDHCQVAPNYCSKANCYENNGGKCINDFNNNTAICSCGENYVPDESSSSACLPKNYCEDNPCVNGTCNPLHDGFTCGCFSGFEGSLCQHDVDDCASGPCKNGANCEDKVDDYTCECAAGYEGRTCETNIKECDVIDACVSENTQECIDLVDDYMCLCNAGFTGKNCSEDYDECEMLAPCLHDGACNNTVGDYFCVCPMGWTGKNCEDVEDYCAENNPCLNSGECFNLMDRTHCQCQGGTTGDNCETQRDLCDQFGSFLCVYGECTPNGGSAKCTCDGADVCHFERDGKIYFNIFAETSTPKESAQTREQCEKECDDDDSCRSYYLSSEPSSPTKECYLSSVFDIGEVEREGDRYKRVCEKEFHYEGKSCQIAKDHCSAEAVCNGGSCKLTNVSYTCDCENLDNYGGERCLAEKTVCPPVCPENGPCLTYMDTKGAKHGVCNCPADSVLAENACAVVNTNFDLAFLKPYSEEDGKMIRSERGFHLPANSSLTVAFWVAVAANDLSDEAVIISLQSSDSERPFLEVRNSKVVFSPSDSPPTDKELSRSLDDEYKWHLLTISWGNDRSYRIVFDYLNLDSGTVGAPLSDENYVYVNLGKYFYGYISQVSVWQAFVDINSIYSIVDSPRAVPDQSNLLLGWIRYSFDASVFETETSSASRSTSVCSIPNTIAQPGLTSAECQEHDFPDKMPPKLIGTCQTEYVMNVNHWTHQVSISALDYEFQVNEAERVDAEKQSFSFGAFDVAASARDREDNIGVCMTRLYVTPKTCASSVLDLVPEATECGSEKAGVEVNCPSDGEPSIPVPKTIPCGKLESYNYDNFYVKPDRIVCGASIPVGVTINLALIYNIAPDCDSDLGELLSERFVAKVASLNERWNTICNPSCDDLETTATCHNDNDKSVQLNVAITGLAQQLMSVDTNLNPNSLSPFEFFSSMLFDSEELDVSDVANAQLDGSLSKVEAEPSCPVGHTVRGDFCVECGAGSYYDASTLKCIICDYGTYSDAPRQTSCMDCPSGNITLQRGSSSATHCVDECKLGERYNTTSSSCEPCPQNTYQNMTGQDFCFPCRPSSGTETTGSSSEDNCRDFCPPGTELRNLECDPCPRGSFRVGDVQDQCTPCPMTNMTTRVEGADSENLCIIPKCDPGSYVKEDGSMRTCELCDYGKYQENVAQFMCESCPDGYTTKDPGTDNATLCIFECPAGQEEMPADSEQCAWCKRGYYRSDDLDDRFRPCLECGTGLTTRTYGATHEDFCNQTACEPGTYLNETENVCHPCPYGTYQPMKWNDTCLECAESYTTENEGSFNETHCRFVCPPGTEDSMPGSMQCTGCNREYYRGDSLAERFNNCTVCGGGMTTIIGVNATSESDCSIRICYEGNFRNSTTNLCEPCPRDEYQNAPLQDSCIQCPTNYRTIGVGSTSRDNCTYVCPAGEYVVSDGDCKACDRGFYKDENMEFDMCRQCPTGKTTNATGAISDILCDIPICGNGSVVKEDRSGCDVCPMDSYQPIDLPTTDVKCIPCSEGDGTMTDGSDSSDDCENYCQAGSGKVSGQCEECARGFWNNGNATMRFMECFSCPENFTTEVLSGANHPDNCSLRACPAGSFFDSDYLDSCMLCPNGTYQPDALQRSCIDCPDPKSTRSGGRTSIDDCTVFCEAGEEGDGNDNCVECGDDEFKSEASFGPCEMCPGDFTSTTDNRTHCTAQFCDSGRQPLSDSGCENCPIGFYKSDRGNIDCTKCPGNLTTSSEASTSLDSCSITFCEPGFYLPNTTSSSGSVTVGLTCEACPEGTYKNMSGNQECTRCGDTVTTEGIASTEETDCYLNVCDAGYYRTSNNTCMSCAPGFYQDMIGQTNCTRCADGYTTLSEASTSLSACRIICESGYFRNDTTNTCEDCQIGFYQGNTGSTECERCGGNYTTAGLNSVSSEDCFVYCPAGYHREGKQNCAYCVKGEYQSNEGSTECIACPNVDERSSTTDSIASESLNDCLPICPAGYVLHRANRTCIACTVGTYKSSSTGLIEECDACQDGLTTSGKASTSSDDCTFRTCDAGFYRPSGTANCLQCDYGTYQTQSGVSDVTACTPCDVGTSTLVQGASAESLCVDICSPGNEYHVSTRECQPCLIGFYRTSTMQWCVRCPPDKTTLNAGSSGCIPRESPATPISTISVTVVVIVTVGECDNYGQVENALREIMLGLVRNQRNMRFVGLCLDNNCSNIVIVFIQLCQNQGGSGRKKRAAGYAEVQITATDIPSQLVSNNDTDVVRDSRAVLEEAFYDTGPEQDRMDNNMIEISQVFSAVIACNDHQIEENGVCVCVRGYYRSAADSTVCTSCPSGTSTNTTGATSETDCLSACAFDSSYCGDHGTCQRNRDSQYYCQCERYYSGTQCSTRESDDDDDTTVLVAAICGSVGGVLLIVLLIFGLCTYNNRKAQKSKKSGSSDTEFVEFKHPVVYNNPVMIADPTMYNGEMLEYYDYDPSVYNKDQTGSASREPSFQFQDSRRSPSRRRDW